jgi:hypothetical protein
MARHARLDPLELWGVDGGQLNGREVNAAAIVNELGSESLRESLDRVFRSTVRRLERDGAIGERGAHLYDHAAVARLHPAKRRQGAVDISQIGHIGDAPEFLRRHIERRGQDRDHRIVDPDIDRPKVPLDGLRRFFHLTVVGHIRGEDECLSAGLFHLATRRIQTGAISGYETQPGAMPCELTNGRPSYPR